MHQLGFSYEALCKFIADSDGQFLTFHPFMVNNGNGIRTGDDDDDDDDDDKDEDKEFKMAKLTNLFSFFLSK